MDRKSVRRFAGSAKIAEGLQAASVLPKQNDAPFWREPKSGKPLRSLCGLRFFRCLKADDLPRTRGRSVKIILEKDEDGFWVATVPSLLGCISQGKTRKQAEKNVKEDIEFLRVLD